jgi:hypothetical protein
MYTQRLRYCFLFLTSLWCAHLVLGQAATGTIYGTVVDSTGAAAPGATVNIVNTGTNQPRVTTSDEAGQFAASLLQAGKYRVNVQKAGFNPFIQENITLDADTTVQVTATLQVQGTRQTVTVSANASMVQTEQTSLTQVIDQARIEDLPLNGRNVLQLMSLGNGSSLNNATEGALVQVSTFANGNYASPISINGARSNQSNYLYDNEDNNEGYENLNEPFPNPDSIQEFTIQSSTFDAQYGRGIGGVVNVITKSGTNQFHGTAFDFLRNYDLNARNFFSGLDSLRRNQFGGSAGGPVIIPHLYNGKDKTFVFGSYQGTRQSSAVPEATTLGPDMAMVQGNLSEFLGPDGQGTILDPTTGNPFPGNIIPANRFDPVSKALLAYLPVANQPNRLYQFAEPPSIFDDDQVVFRADQQVSDKQHFFARYFWLGTNIPWGLIPHNLYYVNTGQYGTIQNLALNDTYIFTPTILNQIGIGYHRETPKATPPPGQLSYTALGANVLTPNNPSLLLDINNLNAGLSNGIGYYTPQETYQINDNATLVIGKQSIRFGGELKRLRFDVESYYLSGGSATFSGSLTSVPGKASAGNAWAEFLLGDLSTWQQQSFWAERVYLWSPTLYAQDNIRLTSKLTVNGGIRWEPRPAYSVNQGKETTFIPGLQSTRYPNAPKGIVFPGDPGVGSNVIASRLANFAPRVGVAYELAPRTVIRAAYGIFFDQQVIWDNNYVASNPPFVSKASCGPPCPGPLSSPLGSAPPFNPIPTNAGPSATFPLYNAWTVPGHSMVSPYSQGWNATVERQITANDLIRISYVGNVASHLYDDMAVNIPVYIPGQSSGSNENQRRPYQPIGALAQTESIGTSNYNGLQLIAQHRYSYGLNLQANYTWAKAIDTASQEANVLCPDNLARCRGVSDYNISNRFVFSGTLEHPQFAKWNNFVARNVFGGWQSNIIFTAQSGPPFTVLCPDDNSLTGIGTDFCDRVPGVSPSVNNRSRREWYNPSAFRPNAIGTFGDEGRNTLVGPAYMDIDYSLFKSFPIERAKLQIRGEAFNVLNHTNLNIPSNNFFSNPGLITSSNPARILQVAAKIIF